MSSQESHCQEAFPNVLLLMLRVTKNKLVIVNDLDQANSSIYHKVQCIIIQNTCTIKSSNEYQFQILILLLMAYTTNVRFPNKDAHGPQC